MCSSDLVEQKEQKRTRSGRISVLTGEPFRPRPQLILASATLRAAFRNGVMREGWLTSTYGDLVKVGPSSQLSGDDGACAAIEHCALVVAEDGSVTNIPGAVELARTADDGTSLGSDSAGDEATTSASELPSEAFSVTVEPAIEGISQEEIAGQ